MSRVRAVELPCTLEIETSPSSLQAHVDLHGFEVGPGDSVRVHGAPEGAASGERIHCRARATVVRASRIARAWTRLAGVFGIGELFEVGFSSRRTP